MENHHKITNHFNNPPISPRQSDPLISKLFSSEFLNNLQSQLNCKLKLPRTTTDVYNNFCQIKKKYEKQIFELQTKMKKLAIENWNLKKNLYAVSSDLQAQGKMQSLKAKMQSLAKSGKLRIIPLQDITFSHKKNNNQEIENQLLREKVRNLQNYRTMKEKRFNEMVAKETVHDGEILWLKHKNEELQRQIELMKKTMKIKTYSIVSEVYYCNGVELKQADSSDKKQNEKAMNEVPQKSISKVTRVTQISDNCSELVESHTVDIKIQAERNCYQANKIEEEEYDLRTSNQIDQMLASQLPYIKTTQFQDQPQQQAIRQNLNQSIIGIMM